MPVYDLKIHPRDRELIAGTHGRGILILDVAPLQQMSADVLGRPAYLFQPAVALQYGQMPAPSEMRAHRGWQVGRWTVGRGDLLPPGRRPRTRRAS